MIAPGTLRRILAALTMVFLASAFVSIAVNSIALGLLAVAWVALMTVEGRWREAATPLDAFFAAYALAELLATAFSGDPAQSLFFSRRLLLIGIVYLFVTTVGSESGARRVYTVLLGAGAVTGALGVLKLLLADPEETVRLGIFQFYMTTSGLMMMATLLLLPFVVHPGTPARIRLLAAAACLPAAVSLYATVTRGAYLAAGAGILFIALVRNRKLVIPLLLVIILLAVFAPPYVENRIRSIVDLDHPDNVSRLLLWKTGFRMFLDHPVFGIGDIDMHALYLRYMDPDDPAQHGHFHNMAVQFLVTLGSVGFLAVTVMFVRIFRTEWRIYRRVRDDWFAGSVTLGALAVFVGLQVSGLTEWSFGDQELAVIFWTTVGMALAVGRLHTAAGRET